MPRAKGRRQIVVIRDPKTGKIIKHKYVYNTRTHKPADVLGKTYSPSQNCYIAAQELVIKKERHTT